jgi:hypothetical protein
VLVFLCWTEPANQLCENKRSELNQNFSCLFALQRTAGRGRELDPILLRPEIKQGKRLEFPSLKEKSQKSKNISSQKSVIIG